MYTAGHLGMYVDSYVRQRGEFVKFSANDPIDYGREGFAGLDYLWV
jgi:hypothetical protein